MRILFFTQYFAPEIGATQARTYDMARALVRRGHAVTVVCEIPNHPAGRIWPAYRGKLFVRETLDGIDVLRVWVKASPAKSYRGRLAFYASYMAMAVSAALLRAGGRYDLVFATSPPLLVGGAGLAVSALRRLPFVFEVRDPWPEAAVALGELRKGPALALARWLERACYRRAASVITVSDGWRRYLLAQGVSEDRLSLIANGANTELFAPRPDSRADLRRRLGVAEDAFVLLYAGLHGIAQKLPAVLDAASLLRDDPKARFVFAGDGPVKPTLIEQAARRGLTNVQFVDSVPRADIASYFSMADMALVPISGEPVFHGMVPAKAFDAWACGTPLLASAHGELCELIAAADGGICVAPENPDALAAAIREAKSAPERCRTMGANGLRFVRARYDRETQAQAFVAELEQAAARDGVVAHSP